MELEAILKVLRQLRESRGLTQKEVAERLGHQQTWLCRLEQGERELKAETLVELCRIYDIEPEKLFELARGNTLEQAG